MDKVIAWLSEAADLAAKQQHATVIMLEPGAFLIRATSSPRDPRSPDGATYSYEHRVSLMELDALRVSPFPMAIRRVHEAVERAFVPFTPRR